MSPRRRNEAWHRGHKNPIIVFFTISFSHYKSRLFRRLWYIYIYFYLPPSVRIVHSPTDWAAVRFFTGESCRLRVNTLQFGERNWLIHHKATSCVINKMGIGIFCSIPYRCRKDIWLSGSGSRLNAISLFFRPSACENFDKAFFLNLEGKNLHQILLAWHPDSLLLRCRSFTGSAPNPNDIHTHIYYGWRFLRERHQKNSTAWVTKKKVKEIPAVMSLNFTFYYCSNQIFTVSILLSAFISICSIKRARARWVVKLWARVSFIRQP
jgi:hypothetical protein